MLVVGAVDDQHAVEVVELVLHDARAEPLELEAHVVRRRVLALERDLIDRSTGTRTPCEREAALLVGLRLVGRLDEPRVDDRLRGLVLVGLEDEERRSTPTCVAARPTPWASCISVDHPLDELDAGRRRTR